MQQILIPLKRAKLLDNKLIKELEEKAKKNPLDKRIKEELEELKKKLEKEK